MKKWCCILILTILININFVSSVVNHSQNNSIGINFTYPQSVAFGEEFNVSVKLKNFEKDVYDVKVDVLKNSIRIAKIWNVDSWKSTFNYVNDAINTSKLNKTNFLLNITHCLNGSANVEVRFKDSLNNLYSFSGYSIDVIGNCYSSIINPANNTNPQNNSNEDGESEKSEISFKLDWDEDEIINGEEFEIKIKVFNLEDKEYDVKIYIYDEDKNKPISQVYSDGKWVSSTSYINKFFRGLGNKTKDIKLKIKEKNRDFEGDAKIGVRIRETGNSVYKEEIDEDIEILKAKEQEINKEIDGESDDTWDNEDILDEENMDMPEIGGDVIYLGKSKTETIKTRKNIVYESKNEIIKKYSIYGFVVLIVILCVLLIFRMIK